MVAMLLQRFESLLPQVQRKEPQKSKLSVMCLCGPLFVFVFVSASRPSGVWGLWGSAAGVAVSWSPDLGGALHPARRAHVEWAQEKERGGARVGEVIVRPVTSPDKTR